MIDLTIVEALKKRYFDAHYVSTKEEVLPLVLKMIPKEIKLNSNIQKERA